MTKQEFIKNQLQELVRENPKNQNLKLIEPQINKIFLGCNNYITQKRIRELETIGFEYHKTYCKNKKQKSNLKKCSGTVELIGNDLIIYLSCKKYDIHYLLKEL